MRVVWLRCRQKGLLGSDNFDLRLCKEHFRPFLLAVEGELGMRRCRGEDRGFLARGVVITAERGQPGAALQRRSDGQKCGAWHGGADAPCLPFRPLREVEDRLRNRQLIERYLPVANTPDARRAGPQKLQALSVWRDVELGVALALGVAQKNLKNIAEATKDLVILGCPGEEQIVRQFAKNE